MEFIPDILADHFWV